MDITIYNKFIKRFTNISLLKDINIEIPKEFNIIPMILILK